MVAKYRRVLREICMTAVMAGTAILIVVGDAPAQTVPSFTSHVLFVVGLIAWFGVLLNASARSFKQITVLKLILWVLILSCAVAMLREKPIESGFVYFHYVGPTVILACIGCGLVYSSMDWQKTLPWLYLTIVMLAMASLAYSGLVQHALIRFGGTYNQPTILSAFLACGLILGVYLFEKGEALRAYILGSMLLLGACLLMTESRTAIVLISLFALLYLVRRYRTAIVRPRTLVPLGVIGICIVLVSLLIPRLSSVSYAYESVQYRLALQSAGFAALPNMPFWGYGLHNISHVLDCAHLSQAALQKTCGLGFAFESTHNVYLDRLLGLGWLGGVSFFAFTIYAAWRGAILLKNGQPYLYGSFALVAIYFLFNVTDPALEILFWTLAMGVTYHADKHAMS